MLHVQVNSWRGYTLQSQVKTFQVEVYASCPSKHIPGGGIPFMPRYTSGWGASCLGIDFGLNYYFADKLID